MPNTVAGTSAPCGAWCRHQTNARNHPTARWPFVLYRTCATSASASSSSSPNARESLSIAAMALACVATPSEWACLITAAATLDVKRCARYSAWRGRGRGRTGRCSRLHALVMRPLAACSRRIRGQNKSVAHPPANSDRLIISFVSGCRRVSSSAGKVQLTARAS